MKEINVEQLQQINNLRDFLEEYIQDDVFDVRFLFESCFKNAKILRDIIDIICSLMWLDSKWKTRLVLIVDELNNNAIEYGSKESEINILNIFIEKTLEGRYNIQISVQDTWHGKNAKSASEMELLRQEREEKWFKNHNSIRGRGLFMIISNLVDNLYFKDNPKGWGLIVGIEKVL